MKRRLYFFTIILFCLPALACNTVMSLGRKTPTPTPIPGIGEPITIQGIDILITSASWQTSYDQGFDTYTPNSSADRFLVVKAKVISGNISHDSMSDWGVSLSTNYDNHIDWTFFSSHTPGDYVTSMEWAFIIPSDSHSIILNLPDSQQIELASLLE